jgi:uncharacterized protein YceH (UPF0502 family)
MTIQSLALATPPLVVKLPRQVGMKESRFAHLLSGEVKIEEPSAQAQPERARLDVQAENERIARLESEIASLRQELAELNQRFLDFKKQFE